MGGHVEVPAPRGRLDQLDETPLARRCQFTRMCTGQLGRSQRVFVATEPVVEQRVRPLSDGHSDSLTARDRVGLLELARLGLTALPGEQPERTERRRPAPGHLGDRRCLLDQQGSRAQLAGEDVHVDTGVERERQFAERTGFPGDLYVSGGQDVPALVVPEIRGG
jgi:hypothetical protein